MANNDANDSAQAPATVAAPAVEQVTLEEFCVRLSQSDRRVELIGGFHFSEKQARRFKDAESNYAARFQAFVNQPV
jgi:hypothetical protein